MPPSLMDEDCPPPYTRDDDGLRSSEYYQRRARSDRPAPIVRYLRMLSAVRTLVNAKMLLPIKSLKLKQYRALVFVCLALYTYLVMNNLRNVCKYVTG
jgi:hypothetical protein